MRRGPLVDALVGSSKTVPHLDGHSVRAPFLDI